MNVILPYGAPQETLATASGEFPTPVKNSRGPRSPLTDCALERASSGSTQVSGVLVRGPIHAIGGCLRWRRGFLVAAVFPGDSRDKGV
jgi:hypothetical protein